MADLGLYNYIKREVAKGVGKEQIEAHLTQTGHAPDIVAATFVAVAQNRPPKIVTKADPLGALLTFDQNASQKKRTLDITLLCIALGAILLYNLAHFFGIDANIMATIQTGEVSVRGLAFPSNWFGIMALSLLFIALQYAALALYWKMRRLGVYLFALLFGVELVSAYQALTTAPSILLYVDVGLSALLLVVGTLHFKDMS